MPPIDRKRITALHEAAHFVAAYVCGRHRYVYTISVRASKNTAGSVSGEEGVESQADAEDAIVVLYAGFAASVRSDPKREDHHRDSACHDDEVADRLMLEWELSRDDAEPRLRERAGQLVEDHWGKIEAFAKVLLELEMLDYYEAVDVIESAGETPDREEIEYQIECLKEKRSRLRALREAPGEVRILSRPSRSPWDDNSPTSTS